MSISIDGSGSISGIDQGLNVTGIVTATGGLNIGAGGTVITTTADGFVGIGTNLSSLGKLEIHAPGVINHLILKDSTNNWVSKVQVSTAGTFAVKSGDTETLLIDSSGRVTMPYQPFFYARPTTSGDGQTANPYTFANVIHNVGNHFVTTGTGAHQRFVAPIDGVYCFQSSPGYKQTSVDWNVYFRINGNLYAEAGRFIGYPSSHSICTASITLKLSANDYVDVANQGNVYHINTTYNYFCGYLLG